MKSIFLNPDGPGRSVFQRGSFALPLLSFITVALFYQVSGYDFVAWDDNVNVYSNSLVSRPSFQSVTRFWQEPFAQMYIPVTYTVWTFLAFIDQVTVSSGSNSLDPQYFHFANLILHTLSVCTVFCILRITLFYLNNQRDRSVEMLNRASFFGALLFSIHPIQVEAVTWVTGMKDTLCGTLSLLSLWQYLLWAGNRGHCSGKWNLLHLWAATILFVLALLAKPIAVVVPLLALILSYFLMKPGSLRTFFPLLGWLVISCILIWIAKSSQSYESTSLGVPTFWKRPLVFLDSISFYLNKVLFPANLTVDYGRTPSSVLGSWYSFFTVSLPILLALLLSRVNSRKVWTLAASISIIGILPVSGLIPFGFQFISTVADRYFYLSMLGPALMCSYLIFHQRSKGTMVCFYLLFLLYGFQAVNQMGTWRDSKELFTHTLSVNKNSFSAHNNLGNALVRKGRIDEAILHFKEAVRVYPGFYQAYNNLGGAYFMAGDTQRAIESVKRVLEINPLFEKARMNLGKVLYQQGKYGEARDHFTELLKNNPNSTRALLLLAESYLALGEPGLALTEASKILTLDTSFIRAYNFMAPLMVDMGKVAEARDLLRTGIRLNPASKELHQRLDALANGRR